MRLGPISLTISAALLITGVVLLGVLFGTGLTLRPANFPDIGVGTNVGSGYSLGCGLVAETSYPAGYRLAVGIYAFWAWMVSLAFFLLLSPVEWALRRRGNSL